MNKKIELYLEQLAKKIIEHCTYVKTVKYFDKETQESVLLPSGDAKYDSFWVRDCAMMAESKLLSNDVLKKYITIIAENGQNGGETISLKNGLSIPPYAIADHINYDGKPVYYPGTYESGEDQGDGSFGFYPPFCDNYFYVSMVGVYIEQSKDSNILDEVHGGITLGESIEYAFKGYNIDPETELCVSDFEKFTVDWGFVDTVKKSGKLLMASLLRYNAALALQRVFADNKEKSAYYKSCSQKIKENLVSTFYDDKTGWFYSATGMGKQYDVWSTAYAVFLGVTREEKTLQALCSAYKDRTAVVDGYVRHILTTDDFYENSAWECSLAKYNTYQNGAYWSTPTGWYAFALYLYNGKVEILRDFIAHTQKYENIGAPFEWINCQTTDFSGKYYGTSAVLPYIGITKINEETALV
ncbi:MAG: hypothetical protein E7656_10020 [Ruminococcaceae bacterium]|nr:hypothetical protein [Oscillospiraceae bacterium]